MGKSGVSPVQSVSLNHVVFGGNLCSEIFPLFWEI